MIYARNSQSMKSNPEGNDPDIPVRASLRNYTKFRSGELPGKNILAIFRKAKCQAAGIPGIKTTREMTGSYLTTNVQ